MWQVKIWNRKWKNPVIHPYVFETKTQAEGWGKHLVKTLSEIDYYKIEPAEVLGPSIGIRYRNMKASTNIIEIAEKEIKMVDPLGKMHSCIWCKLFNWDEKVCEGGFLEGEDPRYYSCEEWRYVG